MIVNYKQVKKWLTNNSDYPREQEMTAHRLTEYWSEHHELNKEQQSTLFNIMVELWFDLQDGPFDSDADYIAKCLKAGLSDVDSIKMWKDTF